MYSRADFDDDLQRIRAFYAERGYPDGRVETFDIVPASGEGQIAIAFHIHEGEPIRIASIDAFGFEVLPEIVRRLVREQAGLTRGMIRTRAALERTRDLAETALKEEGYPYARVSVLEATGPTPGRWP